MGEYTSFIEDELNPDKSFQPLASAEPVAPEPSDEYSKFIDAELDQPALASGVAQAEQRTPDQTAKSNKLALQAQLPPDVVDRNTDAVAKKVQSDTLRKAVNDSPTMQEYAKKDARNLSLVTDDVEHLTGLDKDWAALKGTLVEAAFNFGEGIDTLTAAMSDANRSVEDALGFTAAMDFVFGPESAGKRRKFEADHRGEGLTTAVLDLADAVVKAAGGRDMDAKAFSDFDRSDLPKIPTGVTVDQLIDDPMENYIPFLRHTLVTSIPETAINMISLPAGVVTSAGRLANDRALADGRDKATLGDLIMVLPASLAVTLLDRIGGRGFLGIGDDALKITGNATRKAIAKAAGKAIGGAFVKETVTEGFQEAIESTAGTLGTEKGFDLKETAKAALGGAVGGGPIGGGIRTVTASVEAVAVHNQAKGRTEALRDMNDGESNLRARDPAAYADYQATAMEQAGIEDVTVTPEAARILNQSYDAGIDEEAIAEAETTGGTVTMTSHEFWVMPQEAINEIAPSVSFSSIALSEEEAQEAADLAREAGMDPEDVEAAQGIEREAQEATIAQDIQSRIVEAGGAMSDPADARAGAQTMASAIMTMAQREGIDPAELAAQWVPTIEAIDADGPVAPEVDTQTEGEWQQQTVTIPDLDGTPREVNAGAEIEALTNERSMTENLLRCVNGS